MMMCLANTINYLSWSLKVHKYRDQNCKSASIRQPAVDERDEVSDRLPCRKAKIHEWHANLADRHVSEIKSFGMIKIDRK